MSAWNSYSDPRLRHPGASPASMPGNATPSYNPGIGSPAQHLYLPSPHNNPYLGTPNPYLGTPNPHAMLSPGGGSYPYPAYNPAASPYGYMSQVPVPVQMVHIPMYVEEYNGDNPWELFFQLRDDNNLDAYWHDWAQTEINKGTMPEWAQREYAKGPGTGGFGAGAGAGGAAGRDTLPPSIGKGPRAYKPPNTSNTAGPSGSGSRSIPLRPPGATKAGPSSGRPRDHDRHVKPEKEKRISISDANAVPVPPKHPHPGLSNGVEGMDSPTTPATITATTGIPPGHASSSHPPSTSNTNINTNSTPNPNPAPMISLSRMREAKAQEYTRALKENRPLNLKNVTKTTATIATNPGEDEVTVFPSSSTLGRGDGAGGVEGGVPMEDVDTTMPASTSTQEPVPEVASGMDPARIGAGLDSGMRLNDDEITVYRLGQRGISNEYLASILRPDPNPPTHVLSPEESWSTPAGRVKKGFYAEVVARLVKSRVDAREKQLRDKGEAAHGDNKGDDDAVNGLGSGWGHGAIGSTDELKKEDDEGLSMGWDESELWPAEECDKDLSDLVL